MRKLRFALILTLVSMGLGYSLQNSALPVHASNTSGTLQGDLFSSDGSPAVGMQVCISGTYQSPPCATTTASSSSYDTHSCPATTFYGIFPANVCAVWSFNGLNTDDEGASHNQYQLQVKAKPGDYDSAGVADQNFNHYPQELNLLGTDTVALGVSNLQINLNLPIMPVQVHVQDDSVSPQNVSGMPLSASSQGAQKDSEPPYIIIGDTITKITLTNPGALYQTTPSVSIAGNPGGSGATATATLAGGPLTGVVSVTSGAGACGYSASTNYFVPFRS